MSDRVSSEGWVVFKEYMRDDLPDFSIKAGEYEWKIRGKLFVHEAVHYRQLFAGQFKRQEPEGRTVVFEEKPVNVARLLTWIYTGRYPSSSVHPRLSLNTRTRTLNLFSCDEDLQDLMQRGETAETQGTNLTTFPPFNDSPSYKIDLEMFILADKYNIDDLVNYAIHQIILKSQVFGILLLILRAVATSGHPRREKIYEALLPAVMADHRALTDDKIVEVYLVCPEFALMITQGMNEDLKNLKDRCGLW